MPGFFLCSQISLNFQKALRCLAAMADSFMYCRVRRLLADLVDIFVEGKAGR